MMLVTRHVGFRFYTKLIQLLFRTRRDPSKCCVLSVVFRPNARLKLPSRQQLSSHIGQSLVVELALQIPAQSRHSR